MRMIRRFVTLVKPLIDHIPLVGNFYRTMRDSIPRFKEFTMTPLGFKFDGDPGMENGTFEVEEVELVKQFFKEVDVFVNIGANIGFYCCIALQEGKQTIAFEPLNLNLKYLYRNIKENNWQDEIEIYPLALSNKTGLIQMYGGGAMASVIQGWAGSPSKYFRMVPVSTLDTVLCNRLSGKKCMFLVDIEGAELNMLGGAIRHLNMTPKPIWLIEISINEHQPAGINVNPHLFETFNLFWENGYEAWTANKQLRKVTKEEVSGIVDGKKDTIQTHNFLFKEKLS